MRRLRKKWEAEEPPGIAPTWSAANRRLLAAHVLVRSPCLTLRAGFESDRPLLSLTLCKAWT